MNFRKLLPRPLAAKLVPAKKFLFHRVFGYDYQADGLIVTGHNLEFLDEPSFRSAWLKAAEINKIGWGSAVPDIRWRVHIAIWASQHALKLDGDFVECGVHTGILSHAICEYVKFETVAKTFWLFDTFNGIPIDQLSLAEKNKGENFNRHIYFDCYDLVKESFSRYNNIKLVKGLIPDSFQSISLKKVSFLSIDLNNAYAELESLKYFWEKLVPGGLIIFDDYGFSLHEEQKCAIDTFLNSKNVFVATLPTGQGLVIKPPS